MADATLTRWLARRRVSLGFIVGAAVLWLATPTRSSLLVGGAVAALGEALRIWAAGHLNKSREVTSSGPYRWFAHPLYVGSSVMGAGVAVASGRAIVVLLVAGYLASTIIAAVRHEETFLLVQFGARYESYRRGAVGRLDHEASGRYRWSRVIANREYRAAAGFVLAILLLFLKARYSKTF
jgi:hypothetical protein